MFLTIFNNIGCIEGANGYNHRIPGKFKSHFPAKLG